MIDDGSADATAARAREAGALVASLPFNQGLGAALQTGYLYALREGMRPAPTSTPTGSTRRPR